MHRVNCLLYKELQFIMWWLLTPLLTNERTNMYWNKTKTSQTHKHMLFRKDSIC